MVSRTPGGWPHEADNPDRAGLDAGEAARVRWALIDKPAADALKQCRFAGLGHRQRRILHYVHAKTTGQLSRPLGSFWYRTSAAWVQMQGDFYETPN
jgi:hypothetical protein